MRWSTFLVLQGLIISAILGVLYIHKDRVVVLKKPPQSLAQWYKPQNKRHVWLHTMFKLRREMQAVAMYAKAEDGENLNAWTGKLKKSYLKIAEMVPEWQNRTTPKTLEAIVNNAAAKRFEAVTNDVQVLEQNCTSCHDDYRAITATLYRAPDFSNVTVEQAPSLNAHMRTMSEQVNRIMIGFIDAQDDAALNAFAELQTTMSKMGATCSSCHKEGSQNYPSPTIAQAMETLGESLKGEDLQAKGRALGTLAVLACAECHGTHRLSYDSRVLLGGPKKLGSAYGSLQLLSLQNQRNSHYDGQSSSHVAEMEKPF